MTFEPQVPDWGKKLVGDKLDQLIIYHNWLCNTGIKTGLISPKSKQFVWDEFVVHSLYFGKIISELPSEIDVISDLGTGGGIPGIPIGITGNFRVNLIDVKETRVFELSRLIKILNKNNITIQDNFDMEISHHNGLEKFRKTGCFLFNIINKKESEIYYTASRVKNIQNINNMNSSSEDVSNETFDNSRNQAGSKVTTAVQTGSSYVDSGCLLYTSPSPRDQRGSRVGGCG